ncbi:MAG: YIP1 family protein [Rubrobacteraceae bacterium]
MISVLWSPVRTLREVAAERNALAGFLVVAALAALGTVGGTISLLTGAGNVVNPENFPQLPPEFFEGASDGALTTVFTLTSAALSPFITWALVSLVLQLVTRLFSGAGPLSAMFAVVGVAQMPSVASSLIGLPITALVTVIGPTGTLPVALVGISSLVGLVAFAWSVVLIIIGVAQARNISYGESTGSCAISCAGCLGLIIGGVVVIAVLISVIAGAAGSQ